MTKQYTDDALEFWSTQDDAIHLDICPCCGLNTAMIVCEHCDYDIGKHYANIDLDDALQYVLKGR